MDRLYSRRQTGKSEFTKDSKEERDRQKAIKWTKAVTKAKKEDDE